MTDIDTAERDTAEHDATAAMRAEVDAEPATQAAAAEEYPEGTVEVALGEITIHVLPVDTWRSSSQTALRQGDFEAWAEACLAGDDYERWLDYDPTLGEVKAMFDAWGEMTGQSAGKSRTSRAFSTGTRRR